MNRLAEKYKITLGCPLENSPVLRRGWRKYISCIYYAGHNQSLSNCSILEPCFKIIAYFHKIQRQILHWHDEKNILIKLMLDHTTMQHQHHTFAHNAELNIHPLWFIVCLCTKKHKTTKLYLVHYSEARMSAMASQITGVSIVYWTVFPGADQRKHQSFASPLTGEFPTQRARNTKNIAIWWPNHF